MADIIQARYDALETIASRFGQWAEASNELQQRVTRSAEALTSGGWQGRGAAAFAAEINGEVLPALQRLLVQRVKPTSPNAVAIQSVTTLHRDNMLLVAV